MAKQTKELRWLQKQLPLWVEQGIIADNTAQNIANYYANSTHKPAYNMAFLASSILGVLLIGGGIMAIFAYNWTDLSTFWRTILSFLPLIVAQVVYSYTFFRKSDSRAWVEGASGFLMLMLAASIGLISQTYHIGGSMSDFLLTWLVLSMPLLYLLNASFPAILYLFIVTCWAIETDRSIVVYYWAFLATFLPHFWLNRQGRARFVVLGWAFMLSLVVASLRIYDIDSWWHGCLLGGVAFSGMYQLGTFLYPKAESRWQQPFRSISFVLIFLSAFIFSFSWHIGFNSFDDNRYSWWLNQVNLLVCLLFFGIYIWGVVKIIREKRQANLPILIYPLVCSLCVILPMDILMNLYIFAAGIYYIYTGVQESRLTTINLGMFLVSTLIFIRFVDSNTSLITKGVVFILLGIGFLSTNMYLSKRLKREAD